MWQLKAFPANVIAGMFGFRQSRSPSSAWRRKHVPRWILADSGDHSSLTQIASNKRRIWIPLLLFILLALIGRPLATAGLRLFTWGRHTCFDHWWDLYTFSWVFQSAGLSCGWTGRVVTRQAPQLYLCQDMAWKSYAPQVYTVDDPSMNAFATGLILKMLLLQQTTSLLAVMNREELEESSDTRVSHIHQYDIPHLHDCGCLARVPSLCFLAWWPDDVVGQWPWNGMMIAKGQWFRNYYSDPFLTCHRLSSMPATLVRLAISRQRGSSGRFQCQLTRNPQGMINALWLNNSVPVQRKSMMQVVLSLINDQKKKSALAKNSFIPTHPLLWAGWKIKKYVKNPPKRFQIEKCRVILEPFLRCVRTSNFYDSLTKSTIQRASADTSQNRKFDASFESRRTHLLTQSSPSNQSFPQAL